MTDDIVARLRAGSYRYNEETRNTEHIITKNERLAADEIVRLRGEVERLTRERDEAREAESVLRVVSDGTVARLEEVDEERDAALARAKAAERERDWHKALTQSHDLLADNAAQKTRADAAEAKVAKLREALTETLAIATRNEEGQFAERARAVLQETEQ